MLPIFNALSDLPAALGPFSHPKSSILCHQSTACSTFKGSTSSCKHSDQIEHPDPAIPSPSAPSNLTPRQQNGEVIMHVRYLCTCNHLFRIPLGTSCDEAIALLLLQPTENSRISSTVQVVNHYCPGPLQHPSPIPFSVGIARIMVLLERYACVYTLCAGESLTQHRFAVSLMQWTLIAQSARYLPQRRRGSLNKAEKKQSVTLRDT